MFGKLLSSAPVEVKLRFAVTRIPCHLDSPIKWRVSHVGTGAALPNSAAESQEDAKAAGMKILTEVGPEKFKQGLIRIRETIACGDCAR